MQLWRPSLRFFLSLLLGLVLAMGLHSCQPEPTTSTVAATHSASELGTSQVPVSQEPTQLPATTKAIVATAGPDGLYNPPRGEVRLVVISDLNGAYGATDYDPEIDKAIALIPFWQPDMVVCSGDMVAGQKTTLSEEQLNAMWAAFDAHVVAPLRQANIPYGFTMGNHDASGAQSASGGFVFERERVIASDYWNAPAHDPGLEFVDRHEFPFYYSFKLNDIFFLAWDSSSHQMPPEKLAWVEQALESPEAQSAKIKILLGHLPLYGVAEGRNRPGEVLNNAEQLRVLLERHQVHTYISGHQHAYYPGHKGNLQLLHTGILGSGPRPLVGNQSPSPKSITVVDVRFDTPDLTTYTTYDMQTLQQIELDQLPRFIAGHNGMVLRRDIELDELTPDERANCANQIGLALCDAR